MDENLHPDTCRVIALAEQEAHRLCHNEVEPRHLLLGLVKSATLAEFLQKLGVDGRHVRLEVEKHTQCGPTDDLTKELPLSTEATALLSRASLLGRIVSNNRPKIVEPIHVLLAMVLDEETLAGQVLRRMGIRAHVVEQHLTPWRELLQPWHVSRHYLPILLELDQCISHLERLIWEREYPLHQNDEQTRSVILRSNYFDPLAIQRNAILSVRNEVAALCGIGKRAVHDMSSTALGYTVVGCEVHVQAPPTILKLEQSSLPWLKTHFS